VKKVPPWLSPSNNHLAQESRDILQTQQIFERRLDRDANDLYDRVKSSMDQMNDEKARRLLLERLDLKSKQVLMQCSEEQEQKMEEKAKAIERRAMEVDLLLHRAVAANAIQDTARTDMVGLSLTVEFSLLQEGIRVLQVVFSVVGVFLAHILHSALLHPEGPWGGLYKYILP
jgi:hypothetical protein